MKHLYFIRHGLSEGNVKEVWSGTTDTPLHKVGRAQARAAGRKAKKLNIDLIVSSPLSRAKETAGIIAGAINYPKSKIMYSDLLIERHWGDAEGTPHSLEVDLETVPNIESADALLARAKEALDFLESLESESILVVSHGSFGRALRHYLLEDMPFVNKPSSPQHKIPNAEIIQWI